MNRLVAGLLVLSLAACTTAAAPAPSPQIPTITSVSPTMTRAIAHALRTVTPTPPVPPLTTAGAIVTTVAVKCYPTARDYVDGLGDKARFCKPCGLGVDAQGNLLVADCFNHCIRRVSSEGMVATVAGVCGDRAEYLDGPDAQARFFWPTHAIADTAGNIYVADDFNHRIRLIRPDGQVVTLTGTGQPSYRDGPAEVTQFDHPLWTATGPEGGIYVADSGNNCIRKITLP